MTNRDLQALLLGHMSRIAQASAVAADWTAWLEVETSLLLRDAGYETTRRQPYPGPSAQTLDIAVSDRFGCYAIELKIEGETAGGSILGALLADCLKIASYTIENLRARWVVGVARGAAACAAMHEFSICQPTTAIYEASDDIGVLIITVP